MPDREDTVASTRAGGRSLLGARPPLLEGRERLGSYEIVRFLGGGGMGEVYEAVDTESGHRLAVKVLPEQALGTESARERFLREGSLAASINHPNSLYVYGTEEIDGLPLIAMELAPGGTLDDRVKADGAMAPLDVARAGLQIAAGLAAAAERGVLHRDVKPSNCFVDRDGTVKVGDFGLSVSKLETEATQLTATGAFLGTPAYASPEQIRGEDVDVRSDIYSVGATMYFLLSGHGIFAEQSGLKLMASILERPVRPLREIRPEVTADLAAVVHRCLQKDPAARFSGYDTLMRALHAVVQAEERTPLRRVRLGAGLVDVLILGVLTSLVGGLTIVSKPDSLTDPAILWPSAVITLLVQILYGGLLEGLWGATPGKAVIGLRVVGPDARPPGVVAGLLRSALFRVPEMILAVPTTLAMIAGRTELSQALSALGGLAFLIFWIPARRANGWQALHDRWSRTRVIRARVRSLRPRFAEAPKPAAEGFTARLGPFLAAEDPHHVSAGSVVPAYDPRLGRHVWIQWHEPGAPAVPDARRELSRSGRLRWLNGKRSGEESWDAFEAVAGLPLRAAAGTPQPWSVVRLWLQDLAEELRAAEIDGTLGVNLQPEHVWITTDGRAALLDVAPPGSSPAARDAVPADTDSVQGFLLRVAELALTGRESADPHGGVPPVPLPIAARELLERLRDRAFPSTDEVTSALRRACSQATEVSRGRRALHYGLSATIPFGIVALTIAAHFVLGLAEERHPEAFQLKRAWRMRESCEKPDRLKSLETFIAGVSPKALETADPVQTGSLQAILLDEDDRKAIREFLETRDPPTEEELAAATEVVAPLLEQNKLRAINLGRTEMAVTAGVLSLGWLAHFLAPLAIVLALAFRGGAVLRILGISVVRGDGRPCGRLRAALRDLLAWSPFFVIWWLTLHGRGGRFPWTIPVGMLSSLARPDIPALAIVFAGVVMVGVLWGILRPAQGPQDRLAGTWLVPR